MSTRLLKQIKILFLFLCLHNPCRAQTDSILKDNQENTDSCFLSSDTTRTIAPAAFPSLKKKVLHEKENEPLQTCESRVMACGTRLITCGTRYIQTCKYVEEKEKPHHYWLLVVSGLSLSMMIFLIVRDRKTGARFKKLS